MRQESNHKMNSGKGSRTTISNSRAMGVIILIALLFVFQVTTFVVHKVRVASGEQGAGNLTGGDVPVGSIYAGKSSVADSMHRVTGRFCFNPNTISKDSLVLLGFTPKQAQSIINYREKGGKFRRREDFAKLYVVDSAKYHSLAPYIFLPDDKLSEDVEFVQKSANSCTKEAGNEKFAQKSADFSTKLAGDDEIAQKSANSCTKLAVEETGRGNVQRRRPGRRDTLYGKKVVQGRYMCNLNTADSTALVQLYGIGGYYARKILKYRERLGGSFVSTRQLLEIEGFTQERYSGIERSIFVREEDIKGFSILSADRKALENHPYIGPYAARGMLTYLRLKGIQAAETELVLLKELVKERVLTEENARKLEEYLLYL